jgi:uncharacterized protein (DUF1697 family)
MPKYVALLRGVNLAGNNKIAMKDLLGLCEDCRFTGARTYINSGNVVFESKLSESKVKAALEKSIAAHMGKPIAVVVRTGAELAEVLARNPFKKESPSHTIAFFLDEPPAKDASTTVANQKDEKLALGAREIYAFYPTGMGQSKLKIPAAAKATARNMNTVAKLSEWANS